MINQRPACKSWLNNELSESQRRSLFGSIVFERRSELSVFRNLQIRFKFGKMTVITLFILLDKYG